MLTHIPLQQQADQARLQTIKQHILERAIATASISEQSRTNSSSHSKSRSRHGKPSQSNEHSEALQDLLHILPPLLDTSNPVSDEDAALLLTSKPLSDLDSLIPELASILSANLHSSALSLARITHPSTPASSLHRHIPSLENDLAQLRDDFSSAQTRLFESRIRTAAALASLLQSHIEALSLLIRSVEAKHGPVARSLELRAQEVSLQAQKAEAEAGQRLDTLHRDMFSPETVSALENYAAHLRDAKVRGAERVRNLQRELDDYGVGGDGEKEKIMREMAKTHEDIERQVDEVTKELERLQTE